MIAITRLLKMEISARYVLLAPARLRKEIFVLIFDMPNFQVLAEFECKGWVMDVAFSPEGDKLTFVGMFLLCCLSCCCFYIFIRQ